MSNRKASMHHMRIYLPSMYNSITSIPSVINGVWLFQIKQGDEIDVIKSVSAKNPDHLNVSRVEIINVTAKEESILITARRFKSLLIENYEEDPYKASTTSDE